MLSEENTVGMFGFFVVGNSFAIKLFWGVDCRDNTMWSKT